MSGRAVLRQGDTESPHPGAKTPAAGRRAVPSAGKGASAGGVSLANTPSEHEEQVSLFRWAGFAAGRWPELALMHAIPNGGHRNKVTAAKLKAEGVKAGVPDVFLPVPRGQWHGLYIEMKTPTGRVRKNQKQWLRRLHGQGYQVAVCRNWYAAKTLITDYMENKT